MLTRSDAWVWDFWCAAESGQHHLFYLYAPKSLADGGLRHRNARIGHAVSNDLQQWTDVGATISTGGADDFDATATWTGSVVRGDDGLWRMFYTGARFRGPQPDVQNIETIGVAVSRDLITWTKLPGPVVAADPAWYEVLGGSGWREEAWRDPWVFRDPAGDGWHMLITARSNHGPEDDRGVIGHARSDDLISWTVLPPLSEPGSGFGHLEVLQVFEVEGRHFLLFSCDVTNLALVRQGDGVGGVWVLELDGPLGPFNVARAEHLVLPHRYSARAVQRRTGDWVLLSFIDSDATGAFLGVIDDPRPITVGSAGLTVGIAAGAVETAEPVPAEFHRPFPQS